MTPREKEVAEAIARRDASGRYPTLGEVAQRLGVKVSTVNAHLRTLSLKIPNPHGLPAQRLVRSWTNGPR